MFADIAATIRYALREYRRLRYLRRRLADLRKDCPF